MVLQSARGAENPIKEANNDAGLAAHPSRRWTTNCVHFQLAMLAYNLNCWLMLFNREEHTKLEQLKHTRLATARLRFLFVADLIWKHSGRVGISYNDPYQEKRNGSFSGSWVDCVASLSVWDISCRPGNSLAG